MAKASQRAAVSLLGVFLAVGMTGCNGTFQELFGPFFNETFGVAGLDSPPSPTVEEPGEVKYYGSDEPMKLAMEYFERGNFGLAERYFRDAAEKAPKDPTAWVGLAASYDRLRRFDLADQCYAAAIRLVGETVPILNNQGYSYMLRGDLVRARAKFLKAYEKEPNNPRIINNLTLLNGSSRFIQRAPEP